MLACSTYVMFRRVSKLLNAKFKCHFALFFTAYEFHLRIKQKLSLFDGNCYQIHGSKSSDLIYNTSRSNIENLTFVFCHSKNLIIYSATNSAVSLIHSYSNAPLDSLLQFKFNLRQSF